MPGANLKSRQGPKVEMSATGECPSPVKVDTPTDTPTVTWREISQWQADNKYVLSGYRRGRADYAESFRSLTFMHNETCSIYTHGIPSLLLPFVAPILLRGLAGPRILDVTSMDYAMFGVFFLSAEICLILSTLYHLMESHSKRVKLFCQGMDLLGIVIVTVGTFSSGIYYLFFCEGDLQRLHWGIVSFLRRS
jgi:adiponectin receptor